MNDVANSKMDNSHWDARIKALMEQVGMVNSMSLYQAFKQFHNELDQAYRASLAAPAAEPVMELSKWNPATPYRHCPFCGNSDMQTLPVDCNDKREFFVLCEGCGAQGPTNGNQYVDETVIAWNRRTGETKCNTN